MLIFRDKFLNLQSSHASEKKVSIFVSKDTLIWNWILLWQEWTTHVCKRASKQIENIKSKNAEVQLLVTMSDLLTGLDVPTPPPEEVARYTVRTMLRSIPAAVPGMIHDLLAKFFLTSVIFH